MCDPNWNKINPNELKTDWDLIEKSYRTSFYAARLMNYFRLFILRGGVYSYVMGQRFYTPYPETHKLVPLRFTQSEVEAELNAAFLNVSEYKSVCV